MKNNTCQFVSLCLSLRLLMLPRLFYSGFMLSDLRQAPCLRPGTTIDSFIMILQFDFSSKNANLLFFFYPLLGLCFFDFQSSFLCMMCKLSELFFLM